MIENLVPDSLWERMAPLLPGRAPVAVPRRPRVNSSEPPAGLVAINPRRVAAAAGHGAIGAGLSCSASPVQRRDPRRCRAGVTHQLIVRLPVNVMTSRPSAVAAAAMNAALAGV